MTWADPALAFRGRGPPPVPRRISLVRVAWASPAHGSKYRGQCRRVGEKLTAADIADA
jgi:hypothetical protein